ncbi:MAG: SMP-30/gluconolactonase/LRE family protein [Planctomycetaceae bacterium]
MSLRNAHVALLPMLFFSAPIWAQNHYPLTADSKPQPGVQRGEVLGPFTWKSRIFPGTTRNYWIYKPAQYNPKKPACVMVVQDGLGRARGWKLPTVLDNLIHKKEVPVTIGIFISPGVVPAAKKGGQSRFNRSYEYDGLGDRYARFLLEEILPEVGKKYNLSKDPNDRAIAGSSSGAICAFTVAWERPNEFRRVFSSIGTYVGLRGGNEYPILVRKTETKPIRIFLQDGNRDLNLYGGSWWLANQGMLSALRFSGYDVKHAWGTGGHDARQSTAILPDALRWLWRDYPKPIEPGTPPNRRTDLLIPGEGWELVSEGHQYAEGPAVNAKGEVFFSDVPKSTIHKIGLNGRVSVFAKNTSRANGLMFGPDGKLYACQSGAKKIVRYDMQGNVETVCENVSSNDIVVLKNGGYFTDPLNKQVWYFTFDGKRRKVDTGITFPNGIIASPDHAFLTVADSRGRFTYSFQIQPDGSLKHKQPYGHLHVPDEPRDSGADGMTVDTLGRIYVATRMGLQVLDQPGRCHFIISSPQRKKLSNVVFGGPNLDTLYITCTDKVYRRKIKARGIRHWQGPVKIPRPRL